MVVAPGDVKRLGANVLGGWSGAPARPKRKKIGRDVGEYVPFEEETIAASETSGCTAESASFTAEEQIEDAVWEDIK